MNYIDSITEYLLNTGVYIIRVFEDAKMCIICLYFLKDKLIFILKEHVLYARIQSFRVSLSFY